MYLRTTVRIYLHCLLLVKYLGILDVDGFPDIVSPSYASLICGEPRALPVAGIGRDCIPLNSSTTMYVRLLEMAVVGSLFDEKGHVEPDTTKELRTHPYDFARRATGDDWPTVGHTMVGHLRIRNVREAIARVMHGPSAVHGDFAELGVWRGGVGIYARGLLDALDQSHRKVLMFDAFDTMESDGKYGAASHYLSVSQKQVRHNFDKYGLLSDSVEFYSGLFRVTAQSFRESNIDPYGKPMRSIAVLRVDGNFYESYQDVFYSLYDFVPKGGIVILDDIMSHPPVQLFWKHFQEDQGLSITLHQIDHHSAWFLKPNAQVLDLSLKRQPPV